MEAYGKALGSIEQGENDEEFGPHGGFRAVLSTPSLDRDGDRLLREEWIEPLPERLPLDIDHGMAVADTVGSFRPYFDGDTLMMEATFASTPKAQEVRTLVREGHVRNVSVAFLTDKSRKSGEPRRELLNAGLVATPSNRDAVILASKAAHVLREAFAVLPQEERATVLAVLDTKAPNKKPYGDVEYADPGYRDGVHRYPIDTAEHVRAAWAYIHVAHDRGFYTAEQVQHIEERIRAAAHKFGIKLEDHKADKAFDEVEEKANKKPYGDVEYADPGYRDGVHRYPIDTAAHVRAAWAYIHVEHDRGFYTAEQLQHIEDRIRAAAHKFGIKLDDDKSKAVEDSAIATPSDAGEFVERKAATGGDAALVQAIHDASHHLGAKCVPAPVVEPIDPNDGANSGANKSVDSLEAFEKALDDVLPLESPVDSAAAASDEEPAPAVTTADSAAAFLEQQARALRLRLLATQL